MKGTRAQMSKSESNKIAQTPTYSATRKAEGCATEDASREGGGGGAKCSGISVSDSTST